MTEAVAWQQAKKTLDALKLKHNRQLNLFFESVDELNEVVVYSQVGLRCSVSQSLYLTSRSKTERSESDSDRDVVIVITNFALYAFPPLITLEDGTEFLVLSDHERFLLQDVALCCTPFSTTVGPDGLDYALRSDDFVLYQISGQMAWFRAKSGERSPLVEVLCDCFLALMGQEMEVRQVDHDELVTTLLNHVPLDPEEEPMENRPVMQGYMEYCCLIEGLQTEPTQEWKKRWFVLARDRDQDFLFHFLSPSQMESFRVDQKELYDFREIPPGQRISLGTVILKRTVTAGYITGFELVSQAQNREQRYGRRASAVHVYPMRFLFRFPDSTSAVSSSVPISLPSSSSSPIESAASSSSLVPGVSALSIASSLSSPINSSACQASSLNPRACAAELCVFSPAAPNAVSSSNSVHSPVPNPLSCPSSFVTASASSLESGFSASGRLTECRSEDAPVDETDAVFGQIPQAMEWASRIDRALYVRDIASAKERGKETKAMSKKERKKEENARQKARKQIEAEQYAAYRKRRSSDVVKIHTQAEGDRLRPLVKGGVDSCSPDDVATPSRFPPRRSLLTRISRNSTQPPPFASARPTLESKPASPLSVKPTLAIKPVSLSVSVAPSELRHDGTSPVTNKHARRRDNAQFQANPANLFHSQGTFVSPPRNDAAGSVSHPIHSPSSNVVAVHYATPVSPTYRDEWFKDCGFSSIQETPIHDVP